MEDKTEKKLFVVSLDEIGLTDEQLKQIEIGIQEVVFRELAKIDNRGDFVVTKKFEEKNIDSLIDGPPGVVVRLV